MVGVEFLGDLLDSGTLFWNTECVPVQVQVHGGRSSSFVPVSAGIISQPLGQLWSRDGILADRTVSCSATISIIILLCT